MTRFKFGDNWHNYLQTISLTDIQAATNALTDLLGAPSLSGQCFLDIGCGSGLHSLAAFRLGATEIVSLDYDPLCISGTQRLREKAGNPAHWTVRQADILTDATLPKHMYTIVYAWGSLHHTGHLWHAIDQSLQYVAPGGLFFIAVYNKHWTSPFWKVIKHLYCLMPARVQDAWLSLYAAWETLKHKPSAHNRGMTWRHDLKDWLGGYPYEYASTEEVIAFVGKRGFRCLRVIPNHGTGCSEYLFEHLSS